MDLPVCDYRMHHVFNTLYRFKHCDHHNKVVREISDYIWSVFTHTNSKKQEKVIKYYVYDEETYIGKHYTIEEINEAFDYFKDLKYPVTLTREHEHPPFSDAECFGSCTDCAWCFTLDRFWLCQEL
jgi:hypothetical protein